MHTFLHQGHAEDVIMYHRFRYYVLHRPVMSDQQYDQIEKHVRSLWSVGVAHMVGSSNAEDYPGYIRQGRRPDPQERAARDKVIVDRWLDSL